MFNSLLAPTADGQKYVRVAVAGLTADPLLRMLLAGAMEHLEATDADRRIAKAIGKEAKYLMEIRNRVLHSAWGEGPYGESTPGKAHRVKASQAAGVTNEELELSPDELRTLAEQCETLAPVVITFAVGCLRAGKHPDERPSALLGLDGEGRARRLGDTTTQAAL